MSQIAIAGAGVLGRLAAYWLAREGHAVTVFDPAAGPTAPVAGGLAPALHAAGFTAAGMLSPVSEWECGGPRVAHLGWRSLGLWEGIAAQMPPAADGAPLVRRSGSLLLAHGSDLGAAERVLAHLRDAPRLARELPAPRALSAADARALEGALAPGLHAWALDGEGQVLPREMLAALAEHAPRVVWRWGTAVAAVAPHAVTLVGGERWRGDWVIDARGLGARGEGYPMHALRGEGSPTHALRGVRGEVIWLHAPGVSLKRPLRLLHPRHRVYIVPRPGDVFVVGASEIESEDRSSVSLRSAVELMAAAHSVIPELAEARIVHMEANLRPALPSNLPHTHSESGLIAINGLFRHGWLLAPALLQDALGAAGLIANLP